MAPFFIGTLDVAGGGRLGICGLPGISNPFADDLAAIRKWEPAHVVSMTEEGEMKAAGAADLGRSLKNLSIAWSHLPVRDFGGLDGENAERWPEVSATLHACLDAGGGVLAHCRAGRGRSGMIVLRLMVERGEMPLAALARLREVRPGAVETDEQFAWASGVT
ncbi:MAG: hypothetical protein RIC16_05380 [Rhodospirillales bacterium]